MSDGERHRPFEDRRLLVVSTNYAPEVTGIGPYATQLAEHWAQSGARVRALTGMPHYPSWRLDEAYRSVWRTVEVRGGVGVHRRRHYVPSRQSALRRAAFEASVLATGLLAPPPGRPDVVIAQMPSLAGGVIGARLARRHRVPYIPVVQDLMGAAAAQSGIRGGDRAATLAAAAERYALSGATLVGVIHESFVPRVTALGVDPGRIRTVPNWTHVQGPTADRAATRARLGWDPATPVLLHSGNMGLKQGLEVLVDTARLAPDLRVVLMGDGNQRDALRARAEGLPNVDFLEPAGRGVHRRPRRRRCPRGHPAGLRPRHERPLQAHLLLRLRTPGRRLRRRRGRHRRRGPPLRGRGARRPRGPGRAAGVRTEAGRRPRRRGRAGAEGPAYVARHLSREAGLARFDDLLTEALDGRGSTGR